MKTRDPYNVPPDRRPTNQLRRDAIELAPEARPALAEAQTRAREAEDSIETMARCPLCAGGGLVPPEVAVIGHGLLAQMGERR